MNVTMYASQLHNYLVQLKNQFCIKFANSDLKIGRVFDALLSNTHPIQNYSRTRCVQGDCIIIADSVLISLFKISYARESLVQSA